jgi:mRNA interferase YafQ
MRRIERTSHFRRDFKRAQRDTKHLGMEAALTEIIQLLSDDRRLPERNRDHALVGNWSGYRECHVRPDLILIYSKPPNVLRLIRLGTHSQLFGK